MLLLHCSTVIHNLSPSFKPTFRHRQPQSRHRHPSSSSSISPRQPPLPSSSSAASASPTSTVSPSPKLSSRLRSRKPPSDAIQHLRRRTHTTPTVLAPSPYTSPTMRTHRTLFSSSSRLRWSITVGSTTVCRFASPSSSSAAYRVRRRPPKSSSASAPPLHAPRSSPSPPKQPFLATSAIKVSVDPPRIASAKVFAPPTTTPPSIRPRRSPKLRLLHSPSLPPLPPKHRQHRPSGPRAILQRYPVRYLQGRPSPHASSGDHARLPTPTLRLPILQTMPPATPAADVECVTSIPTLQPLRSRMHLGRRPPSSKPSHDFAAARRHRQKLAVNHRRDHSRCTITGELGTSSTILPRQRHDMWLHFSASETGKAG